MKRSIAFFFLLVFSVSLTGFSVEIHFCKGKITDVALFGHAACSCEKPVQMSENHQNDHRTPCEKHCHKKDLSDQAETTKTLQKKCCKTEKLTLTSPKLKALSSSLKTVQQVILATAVLNPYAISAVFAPAVQHNTPYIPPLFRRDLTILNRVLII